MKPTRSLLIPTAACTALIGFAPVASAAWVDGPAVAGPTSSPLLVGSGVPGAVAVGGVDSDGVAYSSGHAPGGGFSPGAVVARGTADFPAQIGPGGGIVTVEGGLPVVRRLGADGAATAGIAFGDVDTAPIGTAAVAPSGALLAATTSDDGALSLWRQAGPGSAPVRLGRPVAAEASLVAIAPYGADGFVVAWVEARDPDRGGTQLVGAVVTGSTVGAGRALGGSGGTNAFEDVRPIGGRSAVVTWRQTLADGSAIRAASPLTAGTADLASLGEDDFPTASQGIDRPDGGALLTWSNDTPAGLTTTVARVTSSGSSACLRPAPARIAAALAPRDGATLVGLDESGAVTTAPVDDACAVGPSSPAPIVAEPAGELTAGVDADGALVVAVTTETGVRMLVDDRTPPTLQLAVPGTVAAGVPFGVHAGASDPWGLQGVTWSVDGGAGIPGDAPEVPGQDAGRHTLVATAVNAAGLSADGAASVNAVEGAAEPPVVTAPVPPPAPPAEPVTTPPPPVEAPPAAPAPPSDAPVAPPKRATPARPQLDVVSIRRVQGRWVVRVRTKRARRVRLTLYRERYARSLPKDRRRFTCPAPRPTSRPGTGRQGSMTVSVKPGVVDLSLTAALSRELGARGRYTVAGVAYGAGGRRSATSTARVTAC